MKKQNNKNEKITKTKKTVIIVLILLLIALIGGTYAWLKLSLTGDKEVKIKAGTLLLDLHDIKTINIEDSVPMLDDDGLKTTPYEFEVINEGNVTSDYVIYLLNADIDDGDVRFDDKVIKYGLSKDEGTPTVGLLSEKLEQPGKRGLITGTIEPGKTIKYELRLWVDENASTSDVQVDVDGTDETTGEKLSPKAKVFSGKLRIEAIQAEK